MNIKLALGLAFTGASLLLRAVGANETADQVDHAQEHLLSWVLQITGAGFLAAATPPKVLGGGDASES